MSAELHSLPLQTKGRDHYDVTLKQLGEWLAEAEVLGGYRALEGRANDAGRVKYLCDRVIDKPERAAFWEARLRAELEGRDL